MAAEIIRFEGRERIYPVSATAYVKLFSNRIFYEEPFMFRS
jgi:hypothetical protein